MSNAELGAPFRGIWCLDPDRSENATTSGAGLERAVHTIAGTEARLLFHTRWTLSGETRELSFASTPGGEGTVLDAESGLSAQTRLHEDALHLQLSTATEELQRSVYRREGDTLVVEEAHRGAEGWLETRAVYRPTRAKQVMLYRRDLKMRKGKIAAQCAHASMAVFFARNQGDAEALHIPLDGPMSVWSSGRFAKVVLSVEGEAELLRAHELAQALRLPTAIITDSGRTEFKGVPTRTAMAIGPAAVEEVDVVSGPEGEIQTKLA